ncbi:hypothetical protein DSO57_1017396 [Entomophthora muscae]|uniref:Uncharacterized protein n=1 Tax=Entomophthora muscae TaxID=34485 RepID=A0ACC2SU58_9FUNG|nr:hypothetical protein DSO57_1017396 [Entomophthora muscae]
MPCKPIQTTTDFSAKDSIKERIDFKLLSEFPSAEFWKREISNSDLPSLLKNDEYIYTDFPTKVRFL